jgi:predicted amidohydrolase
MMSRRFRVASCQYPIEAVGSFAALARKLRHWLGQARDGGAQLVVLPEYAALELLSVVPQAVNLTQQIAGAQGLFLAYAELCGRLAQQFGIHLLAGSLPLQEGSLLFNRATLHTPDGVAASAEKVQMTPFEREWGISPGRSVALFDTALGVLGVLICYDSEFPGLSRALVAAGAEVLLVPSCTDTLAGYHRVRIACQARALENQCYVVQSVTVGDAPWTLVLDTNRGAAGIYCPPDNGLPADGVVEVGTLDQPAWVFADLDLDQLAEVRRSGQVRTFDDWSLPAHISPHVTRSTLGTLVNKF